MPTYFISDLHLEDSQPHITQLFLTFIKNEAIYADAVYILGDLFEVWIGDDYQSEFIHSIKKALHQLSERGIQLYFMPGNRDFLLGRNFLQQIGGQLLTDPTVINLYGIPSLLMHGDSLCIDDISYMNFREKVRNPTHQKIFLQLPLFLRKGIARFLRGLSQNRSRKNNYHFIDANESEIKKLMKQYKVQLLIHGHTHKPTIQYFFENQQMLGRIVLGDWETFGSVLQCEPSGERQLVKFFLPD